MHISILENMFGIFPYLSKYFNAKIYPASYGNRNRSRTEIVGDTSNNIYETESYKSQLQTIFQDKQESKRKKKPVSLRIRGESF